MPDQPKATTKAEIELWEIQARGVPCRSPGDHLNGFWLNGWEIDRAVDLMRAGAAAAAHAERDRDDLRAELVERERMLGQAKHSARLWEEWCESAERERDEARKHLRDLRDWCRDQDQRSFYGIDSAQLCAAIANDIDRMLDAREETTDA